MAQLAVVILSLFGQMERTYVSECAARAAPWRNPRENEQAGPAWSTPTNSAMWNTSVQMACDF